MADLTPTELKERTIRFYNRYGQEVEQIKNVLQIRLQQIALAYTIQNKLPSEAITISARMKTIKSFLKKLEKKNWPQFYYPTEVVGDLIGARIVCWFQDDCYGMKALIEQSNHLEMIKSSVEDYIAIPKESGYRSLHLSVNVPYDSVQNKGGNVFLEPDRLKAEIQIRTKLQDAWGDVTHEFHYKAKSAGVDHSRYEALLGEVSNRLALEDKSLIIFRDAYQEMADKKLHENEREGFQVK